MAAKLGGPAELVAPKRRSEVEGFSDAQILDHLAAHPNSVRRPVIDMGSEAVGGFTASTRERMERG